MKKVQDFCDAYALEPEFKATLVQRLDILRQALNDSPKSFKWNMRDRVGEKIQWYELPEEVRRG